MTEDKQYDVFISYSHYDYIDEQKNIIPGNIVSQIKELFDANGISYWFDENGIYSGDAFAPIIARNIKAAKIFLFISSKSSNASEWTSNEIATAHAYKKKIIPFRYDNSTYHDSVILYIARLNNIEYWKNPKLALVNLISSIQEYLRVVKQQEEQARLEEERKQRTEQTRKEKEARLQAINTELGHLNTRNSEIDEKIQFQEQELSNLRSEKRIIEASIKNLQDEQAALTGQKSQTATLSTSKDSSTKIKEKKKFKLPKQIVDLINKTKKLFSWKPSEFNWLSFFNKLLLAIAIVALIPTTAYYICERYDPEGLFFIIFEGIAIWGLIATLKRKRSGLMILAYNAIALYMAFYLLASDKVVAYGVVIFYLFACVGLPYLLYKKAKKQPSWENMQPIKTKHPKRILLGVGIVCVILSFAVPYAYAKHCRTSDMKDCDGLLSYSLNALMGDKWSAKHMGDEYMQKLNWFHLEQNCDRALWWYELADATNAIEYCKQYMEIQKFGYYNSDIYGKCGIDSSNNIIKININNNFKVDSLRYDRTYIVSLKRTSLSGTYDAETTDGLNVEGATLKDNNGDCLLTDITGDSVILKYIQNGKTISERVIPTTNQPALICKYDTLTTGKYYTIKVVNPISNAKWEYNSDYVVVYSKSDDYIEFRVRERYCSTIKFSYMLDGHSVASLSLNVDDSRW